MSSVNEIAADYGNALHDLTYNNKTQINMLTILAEDYKDVSPTIVNVLEKEILECPPPRKILLLYVLDSIVKNIPESGQYRLHFAKNIAKIFTHVFEESSEKTRALLYKLRQTWVDIFPTNKLHDIDVLVNKIDGAWPLTPVNKSSAATSMPANRQTVHVNPKFFKKNGTGGTNTADGNSSGTRQVKTEPVHVKIEQSDGTITTAVVTPDSAKRKRPRQAEPPKPSVNESWRPHTAKLPIETPRLPASSSAFIAEEKVVKKRDPVDIASISKSTVKSEPVEPVEAAPVAEPVKRKHPRTEPPKPAVNETWRPMTQPSVVATPTTATISNETPRLPRLPTNNRVFVDGKAYEVIFLCDVPVIIRNGLPHRVSFSGPPRDIMIDGVVHKLAFGEIKTVIIDNEPHPIRFGAPSREFYMRDKAFRGVFGGPPIIVSIDGRRHEIRLLGPPPEAKIEQDPSYELTRYMTAMPTTQQPMFNNTIPPPMAGGMLPQQQQPAYAPPPPVSTAAQNKNMYNEVNTLLEKLRYSGILGVLTSQKKANEPSTSAPPPPTDIRNSNSPPIPSTQRLDNIERRATPMSALDQFSMRSLAIRYDSVIGALLKDRVECPSCGIAIKELYGEAYHQHTAWHMRMLKGDAYTRSRPWFMTDDWFTYSETDLANRVGPTDAEKATEDKCASGSGTTTGDALSVDIETNENFAKECCVCNEKFEEYFDEDDDAWKLRDCIVVDDKVLHRYCRADATAAAE